MPGSRDNDGLLAQWMKTDVFEKSYSLLYDGLKLNMQ
jgi:hypothetical protein